MTDKYKGVVEMEVLGEMRGFKMGIATLIMLSKMEGLDINQLQPMIAKDVRVFVNFMYCSAVQYAKLFKKPEPSFEEVANWLDNMEENAQVQIVRDAFGVKDVPEEDPNPKAP